MSEVANTEHAKAMASRYAAQESVAAWCRERGLTPPEYAMQSWDFMAFVIGAIDALILEKADKVPGAQPLPEPPEAA